MRLSGRIEDPAFDAATTALRVGNDAPDLQQCEAPDRIGITAYAPNRVRIGADMACRGMVVLADTWFPGWEAYVDDRPAQIYAAYNVMRGVVVKGGRHEVIFLYRPASVYGGVVLTVIGLALCLFLRFSRLSQWQMQ